MGGRADFNHKHQNNVTALFFAVSVGAADAIVERLLQVPGIDLEVACTEYNLGRTALGIACAEGQAAVIPL